MTRARSLGLSAAIAVSILSASALSGDQSNEAFSFLSALNVNSLSPATSAPSEMETMMLKSVLHQYQETPQIKVRAVVARPNDGLSERRDAFIARVLDDLARTGPKGQPLVAVPGDIL